MSKRRIEFDPNLLAVCRRRGDGYRVMLVRGNGSKSIESLTWCSPEDLRRHLEDARCGRVLAILPSAATLVRTIHTPPGSPGQVESAIRIEAEARMLGSTPAHRSGIANLGMESEHPTGLVVAWPEGLDASLPEFDDEVQVRWIAEIACLAQLAGEAPDSIHAILDPDTAAIAAVIPTADGPSFRAARGSGGGSRDVASRLRPLVVETLIGQGVPPGEVEAETARMLADADSRTIDDTLLAGGDADERILAAVDNPATALEGDSQVDDRIILAAVAALNGPLAPLADMQAEERFERPGFFKGMATRLSDGRTAVAVAMAAVILLLLVPIAGSGLRLLVMQGKVSDLDALQSHVDQVDNLQKVYRELDRQAWSVTKILGDLSNLMPETIELKSITVQHGEPISISGFAKADGGRSGAEAVFDFNRRLRESGLVANSGPESSIEEPDGRGYTEFSITAELADPLRMVRYPAEEDYAVVSYSERRYGLVDEDGYLLEGDAAREAFDARIAGGLAGLDFGTDSGVKPITGDSTEPTKTRRVADGDGGDDEDDASSDDSSEAATDDRRSARTDDRSSDRRNGRPASRTTSAPSSRSDPGSRSASRNFVKEIPEPITAEEIATLSNAEAKDRLSKVASAKLMPGLDEETKARLKEEFTLIMARVRETAK
ncbi:MAG: PilN domain-containing protein [Phycisphaeraceae bacterium]|nr:PilN domain-containing protein [Phycisphaeraceae bacterium]